MSLSPSFHLADADGARERHYVAAAEALLRDVSRDLFGVGSPVLEMLDYHLVGGKRLRTLIPLYVADHYGIAPADCLPLAAASEAIHHATLAHDDLQDGDETRRGQPAAWRRFGAARAIDLGDALIVLACALLDRLSGPDGARLLAMRQLVRCCARSIDGQERELLARGAGPDAVTVERTLLVAERKTAALFELPLVGAAAQCGAPLGDREALSRAARRLGVCFQIRDDLIDFTGHKEGRPALQDLLEGKRSVLVALACERLPRARAAALLAFLDLPPDEKTPALLQTHRLLLAPDVPAARRLMARHLVGAREGLPPSVAPLVERLLARLPSLGRP